MTNELAEKSMSYDEMIDALKGLMFGTFDKTTSKEREALNKAIKLCEEYAEPKATAKWQCVLRGDWIYEQCTSCGSVQDVRSNYCPDCGAKMEESEDGESI